MKTILFIIPSFDIGGTTVSTRNLISVLDKQNYEVAVWALNDEGILKWMYEDIRIVPTCFIARAIACNGWKDAPTLFKRIITAVIRGICGYNPFRSFLFKRAVKKCLGKKSFDIVVACQEGIATKFSLSVPAKQRVAWVRCDYKLYIESKGDGIECEYANYDHVVCVSEQARRGFVAVYPDLDSRTVCIYNPQDSKLIVSQSDVDDHDSRFLTDEKIIVSVGRFNPVKRFEAIPSIARKLIDLGLNFRWYIIGDSGKDMRVPTEIKKYDVGNHVIMLGAKSNPHFYIKRADLYVCLSTTESCPRVINEAKILGTPVVSTNFPSVYEYLEDGMNGRIVPLEDVADAIEDLLKDDQKYERIKSEIVKFKFDNRPLLEQLTKVL